jgi:hypothetical protein
MQLADITLVAVGCIPPVEPNTALEEENIAVERMAPAALARLHFPVSGMSISRTLFFIPARIPPDSLGFLFFPEEFFYRNLLLAGHRNPELLRNHRNTPEFLFPQKKNYRDLTQDHGNGDALERLRPISWAVVNVRPRPSTSP